MSNKIYIGVSYYPEHWPAERWSEDIRLMKEAGINVIRMAELAWSFLEPKDGKFDFEWLDEVIAMAYTEGIEVILGTPTEASPSWMNYKHPEIILTNEVGHRQGWRGNHCYNNEQFKKYSARIAEKMAEHYTSNPAVIGWQIDNELRVQKCYCPKCNSDFREWLKERYQTLDNLNKEWGTCFWSQVYNSWDEIMLPSKDQLTVSVSQILDHFRFTSDSAINFAKIQIDAIKKHAPHQFVTHNTMGLISEELDQFKLNAALDCAGWDTYPLTDGDNFDTCMGHDLSRGTKRDNFWVMEQKNGFQNYHTYNLAIDPGLVRNWTYQDIARGANGVIFYRWRSGRFGYEQNPNGILRHDGSPRAPYYEIKKINEELASFSEELVKTKVETDVALIYSCDQIWEQKAHRQYKQFSYQDVVMSYYKAITEMGLTADLVSPTSDLKKYKMVISPFLTLFNEEISKNLEEYVKNGGYLILGTRCGIKTWANAIIDTPWPGLLSSISGVQIKDFEVLPPEQHNTIEYKGTEYDVTAYLEMIELTTAKPLATYKKKFYAGANAISENTFGNGTVLYVGVMGNDALIKQVLADAVKSVGLIPQLPPEGIFITRRSDSDNRYTFVLNTLREPINFHVSNSGTDMLTKQQVSGDVIINGLDLLIIKEDIQNS